MQTGKPDMQQGKRVPALVVKNAGHALTPGRTHLHSLELGAQLHSPVLCALPRRAFVLMQLLRGCRTRRLFGAAGHQALKAGLHLGHLG